MGSNVKQRCWVSSCRSAKGRIFYHQSENGAINIYVHTALIWSPHYLAICFTNRKLISTKKSFHTCGAGIFTDLSDVASIFIQVMSVFSTWWRENLRDLAFSVCVEKCSFFCRQQDKMMNRHQHVGRNLPNHDVMVHGHAVDLVHGAFRKLLIISQSKQEINVVLRVLRTSCTQ
jgi:hypothetical protein